MALLQGSFAAAMLHITGRAPRRRGGAAKLAQLLDETNPKVTVVGRLCLNELLDFT